MTRALGGRSLARSVRPLASFNGNVVYFILIYFRRIIRFIHQMKRTQRSNATVHTLLLTILAPPASEGGTGTDGSFDDLSLSSMVSGRRLTTQRLCVSVHMCFVRCCRARSWRSALMHRSQTHSLLNTYIVVEHVCRNFFPCHNNRCSMFIHFLWYWALLFFWLLRPLLLLLARMQCTCYPLYEVCSFFPLSPSLYPRLVSSHFFCDSILNKYLIGGSFVHFLLWHLRATHTYSFISLQCIRKDKRKRTKSANT